MPRTEVRIADYPRAATFGPRRLPDHEFVWMLRGTAAWVMEEDHPEHGPLRHEHLLRPGTLALARAGCIDSYRWSAEQPSTHAYVHFTVDLAAGDLPPHDWPLVRPLHPDGPLAGLCGYLLDLTRTADQSEGRARSRQVLELLWDVFVQGPLPGSDDGVLVPVVLRSALDLVRATWETEGMRLVGVEQLAAAGGVSAGHFSRSFAREYGCGPATALELVRLARAATALERSNLPLAEVARVSGFSNPYHFSRRFSAAYDQPPGRYRRSTGRLDALQPLRQHGLMGLWHLLSPSQSRGSTAGSPGRRTESDVGGR